MSAPVERFATLPELGAALRSGALTSYELTRSVLEAADRLDPQLGTYLARFDESALAAAELADAELSSGHDRGPLHGIPVGVKDIIASSEGPTTAQSLILPPTWGVGVDAPVVQRLRDAGAIVPGKTSTMEFAIGAPDKTKPFPVPRNPWNTGHWTGGSSSGTGNGIAAGLFPTGLGTDTGGSIRIPAAYNGVSGHKPTFGLVPKNDVVPLGFTYDHIGPLARTARDCALVLNVLAGGHPGDPTSVDRPQEDFTARLDRGVEGVRIGVARAATVDGGACDPAVAVLFDDAVTALEAAGATVVDIEFPLWDELHDACFLGLFAEAFAWHRNHLAARWEDYGFDTRMSITLGGLISGGDYVQLQRVREVGRQRIRETFRTVDVIVTPTTGSVAPAFGAPAMDREARLRSLYTPPYNSLGLPALAVPMGFVDGLPASLQIAGPAFADALVLQVGAAYQAVSNWHLAVPELALD